jgi:uncharacterized DUF497 family protein
MAITFDPRKRDDAVARRGLDFRDAIKVFGGLTLDFEDTRRDYGERRMIRIGHLRGRMVVGWTPREPDRQVFSMRKANDREQEKYRERFR